MSLVTVATFLGFLAILAMLGDALLVLSRAARELMRPNALGLAAVVAATATAGSLYFSEVARLEPCALCWYQRIAMYPLVILLGLAALRGERLVGPYVLALAGIGAAISAYHIAVQRLPGLPSGSCSLTVPCSAIQVEVLGFITIPVLALIAFLSIIVLMAVAGGTDAQEHTP